MVLASELASGRSGAIPWGRFVKQARECIDEEYLPMEKLKDLGEPSTMRDGQCHDIIKFWYERQEAGESPVFRFNKYLGTHELFDAKPRTIQESAAPQSPVGLDDSEVDATQSKLDEEQVIGESIKSRKNGAKGKGKERRKAKQKWKGKGKQKDVEEDSAQSSSTDSSSSDEPVLEEDSGDDELDGLDLGIFLKPDEGIESDEGLENVAGGSKTRARGNPGRHTQKKSKMMKQSWADEWTEEEYEGIEAMLRDRDKAEGSSSPADMAEAESSSSTMAGAEAGAEASSKKGKAEASSTQAEPESSSADKVESNRTFNQATTQSLNLEQALKDHLIDDSPLNLQIQAMLLRALQDLKVQSRPTSPQKEPIPSTTIRENKRARSSSPTSMLESPTKKSRELDAESTSGSSIIDLTLPLEPTSSTKTIPRAKSTTSATTTDDRGKSKRPAADNTRIMTRAQVKSTQRNTRSKI